MFFRFASLKLTWTYLGVSLVINGFLIGILAFLMLGGQDQQSSAPDDRGDRKSVLAAIPQLGPRHQLNYQEWVDLLDQEARAVAETQPENLNILAGDSISLWFPPDLLPVDRVWLNQGISGETSAGLLKRLNLFDNTKPDNIFVMIGINDLIRGIPPEDVLTNNREIVSYLKWAHPRSRIIVQSILPHSAEGATWEGRDRLLALPNRKIQDLNQQLALMAAEEGVYYLDLNSLFMDATGNLRLELTTDGLHLNHQGYWVWRSALIVFSQTASKP